MKKGKVSTILRWCFSGFCFTSVLAFGFHFASFILLIAGFFMLPLSFVGKLLDKFKIKNSIAILISIVLFVVGVGISPDIESESSIPDDNTKVESIVDEEKDDKNESDKKLEEQATKEEKALDENKEDDLSNTKSSQTTEIENVGTGVVSPVQLSEVGAYNGSPYIAINNNIPNFSSAELTTVGYEKYSSLDGHGRCGMAIASCGKEIMPKAGEERGSISSIKPSGWVQAKYDGISGGYLWNRCHLIGWQLSAENANRQNLITGTRYMNISGMLPFENMVADYIKETGNHVAYRITPIYEGNNLVCSGVQMEAYSVEDKGDGICFNVYCYNVQPGIVIDYATGNSRSENGNSGTQNSSPSNGAQTSTPPANTGNSSNNTEQNTSSQTVYVTATGKKYHSSQSCSGLSNANAIYESTLSDAQANGLGPCAKCY